MYAGKRCNNKSNLTKRYKLDRVASVDNRPPPDKKFGPKQMCSINNEFFMKKTYIPFEDLCQNVLKEKNQTRKLKFGVHLRNIEKNTHKTCFG